MANFRTVGKSHGRGYPAEEGAFVGSGALSPDERDQVEARAQAVFGIAGQLPPKDFFLVQQAQDQKGDKDGKGRQGEIRTERQGNEKKHHDHHEIHGVANYAVGAGGDDRLPGFDLNDAGSETVDADNPNHQEPATKHHRQRKNRKPQRHRPQKCA